MSYLSTSENVGFSGISQNISDASCATQYKMAVEGVSSCSDMNMFLHDNPADEQTYITQFNDNFYTKFKIDPNELYTFHDSDVIANEITVSHTEDIHIFDGETKSKLIESPNGDLVAAYTNGDIKEEKKELILNGHYVPPILKVVKPQAAAKDIKTSLTKISKIKSQIKEPIQKDTLIVRRSSTHSPNVQSIVQSPCAKSIINVVNTKTLKPQAATKQLASETFLDVFKREQGLVVNNSSPLNENALNTIKVPTSPPKKAASGKTSTQAKAKRGRGPAVHEALQRIPSQRRAIPIPCKTWHAPGDVLFNCGPLDDKQPQFRQLESSSSDDDNIPDFESGWGSVCVEESAAETRGARLALRRAALRRHVARAYTTLRLTKDHRDDRSLVHLIKKQFVGKSPSIPTQTVNHLLAMRGMPAVLSSHDRRQLRESGWSGGESGSGEIGGICAEESCTERVAPCARYCLSHITLAGDQRLYAACAAVFAGGARCRQPLLPLHDHTPLCAEHAWKRDNYDKLVRDTRPRKTVRIRVTGGVRRPRRRRRAPARPRPPAPPPSAEHSLSEINVCSNSSTYDSSEDTTLGALSENEYVTTNSNELEVEVGHVPPDDILDPSVLSQIPDVAFTEFFNQAEGGASFTESSELAAALEAVLEERVLDERTLDNIVDVFTHNNHENVQHHPHLVRNKIQVAALIPTEMPSSAPS